MRSFSFFFSVSLVSSTSSSSSSFHNSFLRKKTTKKKIFFSLLQEFLSSFSSSLGILALGVADSMVLVKVSRTALESECVCDDDRGTDDLRGSCCV
jgi:hypothetical protein